MYKSAEKYVKVDKNGNIRPVDAETAKKMNFPDKGGDTDVVREFDWKPWAYSSGGAIASYLIAKALMDDDDDKDKSFISKTLPWLIAGAGGLGGYALSKHAQADDDYELVMRDNLDGTFTPAEYSDGSGWKTFGYGTGGAGALLGVRGLARHLREKYQMAQNVLDAFDAERMYESAPPSLRGISKIKYNRALKKAGPDYGAYRRRIGAVDALTGNPTPDAAELVAKLQARAAKLNPVTTRGRLLKTLGAEIPEGAVAGALKKIPGAGALKKIPGAGALKKIPGAGALKKIPGGSRKLLNLKGKGGLAALAAGLVSGAAGMYVGSKKRDEYDAAHSILDKYYKPNDNGSYSEK